MVKTKEKINIMGKKYKVEKPISDTLKALSEALHSHEVALMTWVHKDYIGKGVMKEELMDFRKSLYTYSMQIPEAENILKKMNELDKQMEKEIGEHKKETEEKQNKKEKEQGTKD